MTNEIIVNVTNLEIYNSLTNIEDLVSILIFIVVVLFLYIFIKSILRVRK